MDDAFLRRIRHKVEINAPNRDVYEAHLQRHGTQTLGMNLARKPSITCTNAITTNGRCPRASDCRDLLEIVQSICRFRRQPVQLTRDLMIEASASFIAEF